MKPINTPGEFILSFDCEGKFGMADHLTPQLTERLTNAQLTDGYRQILAALGRHQVRATFAFVGAYTLHPDDYRQWCEYFPRTEVAGRVWLEAFFGDAERDAFDGWLNPEPLQLVAVEREHELATHGFTHLPLAESVVGPEEFDRELSVATRLAAVQGHRIKTIVYPLNQIGHVNRLAAHGLIGYRAALRADWRGPTRRLANILAEYNQWDHPQPAALAEGGVVPIPSGHILNFQHNFARRCVPRKVTLARWQRMLERAATQGGVVHLWSHPHNFLTDPGLMEGFERILAQASAFIHDGRLTNPTMADFCQRNGTRSA